MIGCIFLLLNPMFLLLNPMFLLLNPMFLIHDLGLFRVSKDLHRVD